jgi:hypothetical protein
VLPEGPWDLPDPTDQFGRPETRREGGALATAVKIGVLLLCSCPLGAREAFQKGTPAEGRLFAERILDGTPRMEGRGRESVAPYVEGGKDGFGDGWVSVGAVEVTSELLEGTLPDRGRLGGRATDHVLGGLVGTRTAGALGRVPCLDLVHLVANATEARGVFDLEPVG